MFNSTTLPYRRIGGASRLGPLSVPTDKLGGIELFALIIAGTLATLAIAFIPLQLRVPGHAILKATLPIVLGVALVPRPFAGTISGLAAMGSVGTLLAMGTATFQPAAVMALVAIGPAIDLALYRTRTGGRSLYLRFAAAGLLANLFAFAVRWGMAWLELDGSAHTMQRIGIWALLSFAACGVAAGLVSAVICFRSQSRDI
jgi:hypothetical protein